MGTWEHTRGSVVPIRERHMVANRRGKSVPRIKRLLPTINIRVVGTKVGLVGRHLTEDMDVTKVMCFIHYFSIHV